jgi:uncharacterized membrane protein YfcA
VTIAFLLALALVGVLSGATAAIVGFGIGSLLTPLLALRLDMATAVAAVALPHAVATALRCWRLRHAIDWSVARRFGLLSALGGLAGALLYSRLGGGVLTLILAGLLILTGVSGLTSFPRRVSARRAAWALGLVSGFFGGLAGNQGGVRAAALMTFELSPAAFVATATMTALLVDAARTPVYLWRAGDALAAQVVPVAIATAAVVVGTLLGERILLGMPPARFRRTVSLAILALGVFLLTLA